ncbi:CrcB-like protein-domain-containing protein [Pilobolus umbonatus]|nr:CrcB-like protein-domain-containing protein [Pilobolus umbonatus]
MNEISKEYLSQVIQVDENYIAVMAGIIPFSIAGVLIRIGLQRLQDYPGMPVGGLVYAQWTGCFILGLATKTQHNICNWHQAIHPGITSGFCGSITTFSSWQLAIFEQFSNYHGYSHTKGKNVLAALSEFLVTFSMSFLGFTFGQHIGEWIDQDILKRKMKTEVVPRGFSFKYLSKKDIVLVVFAVIVWLGVIFAAIFAHDQRDVAFSCVFAPVGALIRWYLALNNKKLSTFPIGTYAANMLGTAVLASLALVQSGVPMSIMSCFIIQGLADGFCGCLTTVSTFMGELHILQKRSGYIYGLVSIVTSQCLMFLILGTYIWKNGVNRTC